MANTIAQRVTVDHAITTLVEVLKNGAVVGTATTTQGLVTADRNNAHRRTCKVVINSLAGNALVPTGSSSDLINVYGNELRLTRGVVYADGTTGTQQLGIFSIDDIKVTDNNTSDFKFEITGYDRSYTMARARLSDSYTIPSGTNYITAISKLQQFVTPQFSVVNGITTLTTPVVAYKIGDDPNARAIELATAAGLQAYYDRSGVYQVQPIPDPAAATVAFTYQEGTTCTMTQIERTLSNQKVPNHIIAIGTGSTPVRADAYDLNPASPTYINGAYGAVVQVVQSNQFTTTAQAQVAANTALLLARGAVETLVVSAVPYPVHDIDDVIQVIRARSNINAYYVVDGYTMPLEPATVMKLTCRKVLR